jgi:hypothetical protein
MMQQYHNTIDKPLHQELNAKGKTILVNDFKGMQVFLKVGK